MSEQKFKRKKTPMGFRYYDFQDYNGAACSIQNSSSSNKKLLWLGCEETYIDPLTGGVANSRMHIDKPCAIRLVKLLTRFIEKGEI